jgi:hypothetical protein
MTELRIRYLEMIQSVISRMAANQFQARAWSVALGTAVIGLAASKDGDLRAAILAVLPVLVLWILDAYYLALELKYRSLFDRERTCSDEPPSFRLDLKDLPFPDHKGSLWRFAVLSIHAPVLLLALALAAYGFFHHTSSHSPSAPPVVLNLR